MSEEFSPRRIEKGGEGREVFKVAGVERRTSADFFDFFFSVDSYTATCLRLAVYSTYVERLNT